MKGLLGGIGVLLVAAVVIGYFEGWFTVETREEAGKAHADFTVHTDRIKQDKEKLKKFAAEKSQALKEKLAALQENSKGLSGELKTKADKEIAELKKKQEGLSARMKEIEEAAGEKLDSLKKSLTEEWKDATQGSDSKKD